MLFSRIKTPLPALRQRRLRNDLDDQPAHVAVMLGEKAAQLGRACPGRTPGSAGGPGDGTAGRRTLLALRRCRPGTWPGPCTSLKFSVSPERVTKEPAASIGLPFSLSRNRPMASKFSSVKPSGLMMLWQLRQSFGLVCRVIRSRVFSLGCSSGGSGVKASGGWRSGHAEDVAGQEHAAMDRRTGRRVGEDSPAGTDASTRRRARRA